MSKITVHLLSIKYHTYQLLYATIGKKKNDRSPKSRYMGSSIKVWTDFNNFSLSKTFWPRIIYALNFIRIPHMLTHKWCKVLRMVENNFVEYMWLREVLNRFYPYLTTVISKRCPFDFIKIITNWPICCVWTQAQAQPQRTSHSLSGGLKSIALFRLWILYQCCHT